MQIAQYTIHNTNGNATQRDRLRVFRDGVLIGEIFPSSRNSLSYVRRHPRSKYTQELIRQLILNNVPEQDINLILEK